MSGLEGSHRVLRCPECGRVASVPNYCKRPVCVHSDEPFSPEIWDGANANGAGRPMEESLDPMFRVPGPRTWTEMVPYV